MDKIKIYIEGAAKGNKLLNVGLRQSFQKLMQDYGIKTGLFQIIAGGSRSDISNKFKTIFPHSIVLIDSEKEIPCDETINKWDFLCENEKWNKPEGATEDNLFFMAACMESWIVADENALQEFYGKCFQPKLPHTIELSTVAKDSILKSLKESTKGCNKIYNKQDSFKILEKVAIDKITTSNSYAKEFFDFLKQKQENNT